MSHLCPTCVPVGHSNLRNNHSESFCVCEAQSTESHSNVFCGVTSSTLSCLYDPSNICKRRVQLASNVVAHPNLDHIVAPQNLAEKADLPRLSTPLERGASQLSCGVLTAPNEHDSGEIWTETFGLGAAGLVMAHNDACPPVPLVFQDLPQTSKQDLHLS